MSIAMVQMGLEPNGCGPSTLVKNRHQGGELSEEEDGFVWFFPFLALNFKTT